MMSPRRKCRPIVPGRFVKMVVMACVLVPALVSGGRAYDQAAQRHSPGRCPEISGFLPNSQEHKARLVPRRTDRLVLCRYSEETPKARTVVDSDRMIQVITHQL